MIKIFLVDDEPPARRRMKRLLKPFLDDSRIIIVGEAGDGVEALEKLPNCDVDLLFLDIQMPELDGFDVLERLPEESRPEVVFVTAYDEYAVRAFEENAVDYLLKPVSKDRLAGTITRMEKAAETTLTRTIDGDKLEKLLDFIDRQDATQAETPAQSTDAPAISTSSYLKQISVPYRDRILIIKTQRLVSVEVNDGITTAFILSEDEARPKVSKHILNHTLDQMEHRLNPDNFIRVHRSVIVSLDHITELIPWFSGRYKLILAGGHEVIASRERARKLKKRMMV